MLKKLFLLPVFIYRYAVSPFFPSRCIYTPSCSQYMIEAVEKHGVIKGFLLGIKRFFRCRPGIIGCYDPVPEVKQPTDTRSC